MESLATFLAQSDGREGGLKEDNSLERKRPKRVDLWALNGRLPEGFKPREKRLFLEASRK